MAAVERPDPVGSGDYLPRGREEEVKTNTTVILKCEVNGYRSLPTIPWQRYRAASTRTDASIRHP